MKIDIGGGTKLQDGHINLDPVHGEGEWKRLAQDIPWPVEDNSVQALHASHVLEHILASDRIAVFNEAWRVLRPGGKFTIHVPLVGYTDTANQPKLVNFWGAWADPTHVSYWWFPESLYYFYGDHPLKANADYGMSPWNVGPFVLPDEVDQALSGDECFWSVLGGWEGVARIEKTLIGSNDG
jgi:SAM-dependent methyltransferase